MQKLGLRVACEKIGLILLLMLPCTVSFCVAGEPETLALPELPGIKYNWEWAQWGKKGGSFWVNNSIWNAAPLVMNKEYAQSVNVDGKKFPNGTSLIWNYPQPADYRIFSFPEIVFGQSPGKTAAYMPGGLGLIVPPMKKVNRFRKLSASYEVEVSGESFAKHNNVAFDLWLTPGMNYTLADRKFEVFIGVHLRASCEGKYSYHLKVPSYSADVWLFTRRTWTEICLDPGIDIYSGVIVISDILADLAKHDVISGEEYLGGIEFGAEPGGGIGVVKINKFNVLWD